MPVLVQIRAAAPSDTEPPACLQQPRELQVDKPAHNPPQPMQLPSPAARQTLASVWQHQEQQQERRRDPEQTRPGPPKPALVHTRQGPTARPNRFENRFVSQFPFFPHVVTIPMRQPAVPPAVRSYLKPHRAATCLPL